jgi:hypothetical protein
VVLDPRVDLGWQLEAEHIHKNPVNTSHCTANYAHESSSDYRRLFARPYAIWTTPNPHLHMEPVGRIFRKPPTVQEIFDRLAADERKGYLMELLAYHRKHPELLEKKLLIIAGASLWPSLNFISNGQFASEMGMSYIDIVRWSDAHYQKALRSYPHDWSLRYINEKSVTIFGTMIVGKQVIRLGHMPEKIPTHNEHGVPLAILHH